MFIIRVWFDRRLDLAIETTLQEEQGEVVTEEALLLKEQEALLLKEQEQEELLLKKEAEQKSLIQELQDTLGTGLTGGGRTAAPRYSLLSTLCSQIYSPLKYIQLPNNTYFDLLPTFCLLTIMYYIQNMLLELSPK